MSARGPGEKVPSTSKAAFGDALATIDQELCCQVAKHETKIIASSASVGKLLVKATGCKEALEDT
eukprot:996352-Prorocentrum_lima.AAC.1